jgi:hypothetical protein
MRFKVVVVCGGAQRMKWSGWLAGILLKVSRNVVGLGFGDVKFSHRRSQGSNYA